MSEALGSSLERAFEARWEQLTREIDPLPPAPRAQVRFDLERDFIFDCAWIDKLVYVELHGGGRVNGRHNRDYGMVADFEKANLAVSLGWRGVYATSSMIMENPEPVIQTVLTLLDQPVLSPDAELSMWTARVRNLVHADDEICNNGITVRRLKTNKFLVVTGKSEYQMGGRMPLIDAQRQVLDFILRAKNSAATPVSLMRQNYVREKVCF